MKRSLFAAAAIAGALLVPAAASAHLSAPDYRLDAYAAQPLTPGYSDPVVTDAPLTAGVWYVAEVEGTISYYRKRMWEQPFGRFSQICGDPLLVEESHPDWKFYRSDASKATQLYVGMDAETVFARPCDGTGTPRIGHWTNFEINPGSGYSHIEPTDGAHNTRVFSSAYDYAFKGQGVTAKFHLRDIVGATRDNYGMLDIMVRPADSDDCWLGAGKQPWKAFGFTDWESCWHGLHENADGDTYVAAAREAREATATRSARR